jgi:hypothetical protein
MWTWFGYDHLLNIFGFVFNDPLDGCGGVTTRRTSTVAFLIESRDAFEDRSIVTVHWSMDLMLLVFNNSLVLQELFATSAISSLPSSLLAFVPGECQVTESLSISSSIEKHAAMLPYHP